MKGTVVRVIASVPGLCLACESAFQVSASKQPLWLIGEVFGSLIVGLAAFIHD